MADPYDDHLRATEPETILRGRFREGTFSQNLRAIDHAVWF
jgi:hypothetical protein